MAALGHAEALTCVAKPAFQPVGAVTSYSELVHEERLRLGNVPTRIYRPRDAQTLLLLGHGGGHSKDEDRFVSLCRYFADETGQAVVCIDAVDHGERRPHGATADLPRAWHSRAVPAMVDD